MAPAQASRSARPRSASRTRIRAGYELAPDPFGHKTEALPRLHRIAGVTTGDAAAGPARAAHSRRHHLRSRCLHTAGVRLVETLHTHYDDMPHGFLMYSRLTA
jgi:hypothetical protein